MPADAPTILATSGGYRRGRRTQLEFDALVHHAVELSGAHGRRPRVTFVGTASGDPRFMNYWALEAGRVAGFDVTCLDLFPMPNLDDVPGHLLQADVVWVNGGSVANLLAVWDVHDLRPAMRAAWEAGVVLSGVSAGAICWYVGGCTDSFGPRLRAVTNGLALLPYGSGVHYDSEARASPDDPLPRRRRDPARDALQRRRGRAGLPRHRARRSGQRHRRHGGLRGQPRAGRLGSRLGRPRGAPRAPPPALLTD